MNNKNIYRSPGVFVHEPPTEMDILRRELSYYTIEQIFECIGADKIQKHLLKIKNTKNGYNN